MTIEEYNLYSKQQQADILYKKAVYVGKRKLNNRTIVLYQLESFYVEIFYRKYRHYIDTMRCAASPNILNPYLDQIDISELEEIFADRKI